MGFVRGLVVLVCLLVVVAVLARPSRERLLEVYEERFGPTPERLYQQAERQFTAGDFEKAELSCEKALKREPHHAPARALLMEVRFMLGRGVVPASTEYEKYMHTQTFVERDNDVARAN